MICSKDSGTEQPCQVGPEHLVERADKGSSAKKRREIAKKATEIRWKNLYRTLPETDKYVIRFRYGQGKGRSDG